MRRFLPVLIFALLAAVSVTFAAAKTYQYTGTVKTVDGGTFSVQKSATDTSTFSIDSSTKGTPKVGDKVTVIYTMVASSIDVKK
jgi:hypothetical protein